MNDKSVIWIHDEMISTEWLLPDHLAVFVFDDNWIEDERISLKRIVFMYECLKNLPGVEIRKGNVVKELQEFYQEHSANKIRTVRSPLPRIKRQGAELDVEWLDPEPLVNLPPETDMKRFSRYWRKAEKQVIGNG